MINPLTSREIVHKLRGLGFSGPYHGGNHQYMVKGNLKVRVPNPHHGETIGVGLVKKIIGQAGLTEEEWEKA